MLRGAIYGLTAAAIWGGVYVVADVVLETIPPLSLLTLRLILGGLVLAPFLLRQPNSRWLTRKELRQILPVGIVGFGISLSVQFIGTEKSTAVNGALITTASPAFILVFAALILREKLTFVRILAVSLASIGVLIIIDIRQADFSSDTFIGDIALMMAGLTWGLYSVLVRRVSYEFDTLTVTFWAFVGGLLVTIPATVIEFSQQTIGQIDIGIIAGVLYLGIISTTVAMWFWNRAFALVDASVASLFFFAQPLTGAALAVMFLGQKMTSNLWIGSFFIIGGVLLALLPNQLNKA